MTGKRVLQREGRPARAIGHGDRYRLLRLISDDPLGQLWEAQDEAFREPVTVRIVHRSLTRDPRRVAAFRKQLGSLFPRLAHPHIAAVYYYNYGTEEPVEFVVMEEIQGATLAQRERTVPRIGSREAAAIGAAIADGLTAAHDLGSVHGALTAHSVMLTDGGFVRVLDFGVAALRTDHALDQAGPDPADDVRALAVLLGEAVGVRTALDPGDAPPRVDGWPPGLSRLWGESLSPDPGERPGLDVMGAALREAAERGGGRSRSRAAARRSPPESSPPAERSEVVIREDSAPPVTPPLQNGQSASAKTSKGVARPPRVEGAGKAEEPRKTPGEHRARRGPRWSWLGTAAVVAALAALSVALLVRPTAGPENEPPVRGSPETTTNPARIVMPDLRGMPYEEALSLLEGQDLLVRTVEVQGDPGVVVATDPSLGQVIPPGTRVTLYVGR